MSVCPLCFRMHLDCICYRLFIEGQEEKPTFRLGDRVMVKKGLDYPRSDMYPVGLKGVIEQHNVPEFFPYLVRFDDGKIYYCNTEILEEYFAKAVNLSELSSGMSSSSS